MTTPEARRRPSADTLCPMADTLTITDNRTGKQYEVPITDGTIKATDLRKIKTDDADDFGLMTYDPAFMNTAVVPQPHHLHRRRQGHPALPRLPDRAAGRAQHLPRDRLPDPVRRAADGRRSCRTGRTRSRCTRWCTRTSRSSWRASPTTPIRWACSSSTVGAMSTFYPDGKQIFDAESRASADPAADRQDADHRGLRLPPQHRPALRLPRQRPQLHRQLPEHAVQDDRAEVPAEPGARARARRAVHPARRPRAELLDQRDARHRQLARRSVLGAGRRGRGALRPAARRRQRSRAADAARRSARWPTSRPSSRRSRPARAA